MKLLTALAFLVISTGLFAATPYSFKCTKTSDGSCSINQSNAHVMSEVQTGIYSGTEGEYSMFYANDNGSSILLIFKGSAEIAQAEGRYLAVPTATGYTGVILVDGLIDEVNTLVQPKL